jgi:phosphonate transport system substrate-binding protein
MVIGRCLVAIGLILLYGLVLPAHLPVYAQDDVPRSPPADARVLRLGIAPFNATAALLRLHQPLRDYLMRTLGRGVIIYTSKDHGHFLDDALNGNFDVVITTAHFLPMMVEGGFVPLVRYKNPFFLVLLVKEGSEIHGVKDLRGHRIGLPDRLSLFHIAGLQWLDSTGMKADVDYSLSAQQSHMAGILAVDQGQIGATITAQQIWLQLEAGMRERFRLIDSGRVRLPTMTTLAHRELGAELVEKIRVALLAFPDSPEGQSFFTNSGYGGYVASTPADLEAGKTYERLVRQLWAPKAQEASRHSPPLRAIGHE